MRNLGRGCKLSKKLIQNGYLVFCFVTLIGAGMKIVMINDGAFVGETLLKYMPPYIEKQYKRSRGLWSKTFGLAYKIFVPFICELEL